MKSIQKPCHLLNPKNYSDKYLGHKIHCDQNRKSGMFGVVHVCALDGFSSKLVGHGIIVRKINLVINEEAYRLMITFFIYKDNVYFGFFKYFEVSYSLRNSLRCNIKSLKLSLLKIKFKFTKFPSENN